MYTDFVEYLPNIIYILSGITLTLKYSAIGVFFGIIIGTMLALAKSSNTRFLRVFANAYTSIFRGTPILIQLSIIYFALPALLNLELSVFTSCAIAFSCNSGAYVSEIIRSGIASVDVGEIEAAKVLCIPQYYIVKQIILPQALRNIFPALVNEVITLVKESALVSTLGVLDLMGRAKTVAATTYSYFEPLLIAALTYYILVLVISTIGKKIEKKLKLH